MLPTAYPFIRSMPLNVFIDTVTAIVHFNTYNYAIDEGSGETIPAEYAESVAYIAACFIAQRYDIAVETCVTLRALRTDKALTYAERSELVQQFIADITE